MSAATPTCGSATVSQATQLQGAHTGPVDANGGGLVADGARVSGIPGLRFRAFADWTASVWQGWQDTANAVRCNHPPGSNPRSSAAQLRLPVRRLSMYNLLQAAAQEGVKHLVYLSSLAVMTGYPEDLAVDEDWRPLPKGDSPGLAEYLGEVVCREFAREGKVHVVVLRLGKVVQAEGTAEQPFQPLWVAQADVVHAVSLALSAQLNKNGPRLGAWSVFHILSGSRRVRYSIDKARRLLGYRPHVAGGER